MNRSFVKPLAIACFSVAILGLGLHLNATAVIRENYITLSSGATCVENVPMQPDILNNNVSVYLSVYIEGISVGESAVILVNASEYERFTGGAPFASLIPIATLDGITWISYSNVTWYETNLSLVPQGPVYIITWNGYTTDVNVYTLLSAISPLYDGGLIIGACGALAGVAALAWLFSGWKRYLLVGVGMNLIPFVISVAMLPDFSNWSDFQARYVPWADVFLSGAPLYSPLLSAYPQSQDPGAYAYPYPPLFVITLAGFDLIPAPPWKMALPLFAANLATGYLVYRITYKLTGNEHRASIAMMLYFLNPFTLYYGSFSWMNPPLFVFFLVLAFDLALERKGAWAMVSLGIATMYKQLSLPFFPLLLLVMIKDAHPMKFTDILKAIIKPAMAFGLTILAISTPVIVMDAPSYVHYVFLEQVGSGSSFSSLIQRLSTLPPMSGLITFTSFFVWVGAPEGLVVSVAFLLQSYILLGTSIVAILLHVFRFPSSDFKYGNKFESQRRAFMVECLFTALLLGFCLQLFFPRGSYKYYLMALTPFISIFYDHHDLNLIAGLSPERKTSRWWFFTPIALSWLIFWFNRYAYFWILFAWVIFYVTKKRSQGRVPPSILPPQSSRRRQVIRLVIVSLLALVCLLLILIPDHMLSILFIPYWKAAPL